MTSEKLRRSRLERQSSDIQLHDKLFAMENTVEGNFKQTRPTNKAQNHDFYTNMKLLNTNIDNKSLGLNSVTYMICKPSAVV